MFNNIIGWHPVGYFPIRQYISIMLTKTMPELFFIHSDLDIVYANPMACTFRAESPEELTGTPLIDPSSSDYRSPLRERVAHIYGGDERTSGLNVELQTDTDQPQRAILREFGGRMGRHRASTNVGVPDQRDGCRQRSAFPNRPWIKPHRHHAVTHLSLTIHSSK